MHLPALTDRELAHHADLEFDPLTATDLQVELARRFTALLDRIEPFDTLADKLHDLDIDTDSATDVARVERLVAADNEFSGWPLRELLELLQRFDVETVDALEQILNRDAKVADAMNDLAEPLASLQALVTPA
jgi:hypothetical protein